MSPEEIAARIDRTAKPKRNGSYELCCPAHEDGNPSLTVSPGLNGRTVVHCHTGCHPADVMAAIGLSLADLMPPKEKASGDTGRIAATYDYTDENGVLLFQCVRFEPKGFRQRRPDGHGGWVWNLNGVRRVLFNLPAVLQAKIDGKPIVLTEGEKDALAVQACGMVATTNPMGAGKWDPQYTEQLTGATVFFIPDTDAKGQEHRAQVCAALDGSADVTVLELQAPYKDVAEYLAAGRSLPSLLIPPADRSPPPTDPPEPDDNYSDRWNADRLTRLYGDRLRYCWPLNCWYVYTGTHWTPDDTGQVMQWAKATVRDMHQEAANSESSITRKQLGAWAIKSESAGKLNAMIELARSNPGIPVRPDQFDAHPNLLNCTNGTLDLSTRRLGPHRATDLITTILPFAYDPAATAPLWRQVIGRSMAGKGEMLAFLQRAVGYSLTGQQSEQCFFFLHGSGANGKSVFLNTIMALFGNAGRTAAFSTFLSQRDGGRPRQDIARLAGARLVTAAEAGEGQRFDEELLKAITGGERITARKLYADDFEFTPQFTLWLAANHQPTIRGADLAIWRRVCLIPFTVTVPEEERDKRLLSTNGDNPLTPELPGILNWALEGHAEWQMRGLAKPPEVIVATEEYREASDPLGDFLAAKCKEEKGGRITSAAIYKAYKAWCEEMGEEVRSKKWVGGGLKTKGIESVKVRGLTTYLGLSLSAGGGYEVSAESAIGKSSMESSANTFDRPHLPPDEDRNSSLFGYDLDDDERRS